MRGKRVLTRSRDSVALSPYRTAFMDKKLEDFCSDCRMLVAGKKLVLWRDGEEQWHCFEDACPHR